MSARRQIVFWAVGLVAVAAFLYLLSGILLPFIAGLAVAYLLDPIVDRLEAVGPPRWLATGVVTAAFFALIVLAVILIFPLVQGQVADLIQSIPALVRKLQETVVPVIERVVRATTQGGESEAARAREATALIAQDLTRFAGNLLSGVLSSGLALFNLLALVFITPVVAFYLLRDWDRLVARVDGWLPRQHQATIHGLFREMDEAMAGFLRGQGLVCLLLAAFYAVGLTLAGLRFGLVIGLFSGFIAFIPYVGFYVGFAAALIFALIQYGFDDLLRVAIIIAIYLAGQLIEGTFLTPKLVGSRIGLHPVWVIFALLASGVLFGFIGVVVAVPLAAIIGVLVRFALRQYLQSPIYLGREPHPPSSAATPGDGP